MDTAFSYFSDLRAPPGLVALGVEDPAQSLLPTFFFLGNISIYCVYFPRVHFRIAPAREKRTQKAGNVELL